MEINKILSPSARTENNRMSDCKHCWIREETFGAQAELLLPAKFLCATDSNLTAAFRLSRRRTSSSSIRANVSACRLGRKAGRPIITEALGNIGANGLATRVRGMMLMMPSVRIAAAWCASNSVNSVETPSFTSETKRGNTLHGSVRHSNPSLARRERQSSRNCVAGNLSY